VIVDDLLESAADRGSMVAAGDSSVEECSPLTPSSLDEAVKVLEEKTYDGLAETKRQL
jgi:hypothetical protein